VVSKVNGKTIDIKKKSAAGTVTISRA